MMEPRENPSLFGHEAVEADFAAAVAGSRLHHAWLITGIAGIGKATLAYRLARRLLGGRDDPADAVFRRVARATHADLLTLERAFDEKRKRQRTEIVVEGARDIAGFLRLTPAEGGWRVVVVDGAEYLNRNAANALLKILEEPPPRAVLLLTCAAPGRLLPTIRSRCRKLGLASLDEADMGRALGAVLPALDDATRTGLIGLAGGAPGRAALLADEGGLAIAGLVDEVLQATPNLPAVRAYEVADRLTRSETGYSTFMELLRDRLGTAVREAARGRVAPLAGLRPLERTIQTSGDSASGHRTLEQWVEVWHALGRLQDETERANLDKRHAIVAGLDLLNAR